METYLDTLGPDTVFQQLPGVPICLLNVHFSNDDAKRAMQVLALEEALTCVPMLRTHTLVVVGDFNASVFVSQNHQVLTVRSRESSAEVQLFCATHSVYVGENQIPTTCKIRVISTQVHKILKEAFACVDWCLLFTPSNVPAQDVSVKSSVLLRDECIQRPQLPPTGWPSDHFALHSEIHFNGHSLTVLSLNVLGESITSGELPLNVFEFMSRTAYDEFLQNPLLEHAFHRVFGAQPGIGDESFQALVARKAFSKGLRRVALMDIHKAPFQDELVGEPFTDTLVRTHTEAKRDFESTASVEQRVYVEAMERFFHDLYTDPNLQPWFYRWYCDFLTSPRYTLREILQEYCAWDEIDIIALQEVSFSMLRALETHPFTGYELILGNKDPLAKTRGVLLLKKSSFEQTSCNVL